MQQIYRLIYLCYKHISYLNRDITHKKSNLLAFIFPVIFIFMVVLKTQTTSYSFMATMISRNAIYYILKVMLKMQNVIDSDRKCCNVRYRNWKHMPKLNIQWELNCD